MQKQAACDRRAGYGRPDRRVRRHRRADAARRTRAAGLALEADPDRGAVRGGRLFRHRRPLGRAADADRARPEPGRRERAGCERRDRGVRGRARAGRRLHLHGRLDRRVRDQRRALPQAPLRPAQGPRAADARGGHAQCAGDRREVPGPRCEVADCVREAEPGTAELGVLGHGLVGSPVGPSSSSCRPAPSACTSRIGAARRRWPT